MEFDALTYPYSSKRTVVYGQRGMVAASQPLAAEAGLRILQQGGNAVDAALAAAATLTVVEPTSNGLGGDLFAIVHHQNKMYGLNSSGRSPRRLTAQWVEAQGHKDMPTYGWLPVTVPGIPGGWAALAERFGRLSLAQTLEPAAQRAEEGYPVSPVVSQYWRLAAEKYRSLFHAPEFANWFRTFAADGEGPHPGECWRSSEMANTLRTIGSTNAESFYRGDLAAAIAEFSAKTGGLISAEDLDQFRPDWVDPISVTYRGHKVWELPPNGQGLVALMALGILDGMPFSEDTGEWTHTMIEAVKLAFADGRHWITDPDEMTITPEQLLHPEFFLQQRQRIGAKASVHSPAAIDPGGTVYLAAADRDGTMISLIQSNYMGFGSGVVVPGTGIALQNRAHTFSLDPNHANYLRPERRTYHTIIPGFLSTLDNKPIGPFGVMGGFMQPQGHVQVLSRYLDEHLNPQAALDAPRFYWEDGLEVLLERNASETLITALRQRGHQVKIAKDVGLFGRGQIIWRLPNDVLAGGTEPRADGAIGVW